MKTIVTRLLIVALAGAQVAPAAAQTKPAPWPMPTAQPSGSPPGRTVPVPQPPGPPFRPQPQPPRPPIGPQPQPPRPPVYPPHPGYPGGTWPGPNGPQHGGAYRGEIRCRAFGGGTQTCQVPTENRVALVRVLAGRCLNGRDWGWSTRQIWVRNGCFGAFAYGYGRHRPSGRPDWEHDRDRGPNTALVIGGVVVAAGLIAALTARREAPRPGTPAGAPARLNADFGGVRPDAREAVRLCLDEGARQVGATGGSRLRLDRIERITREDNGWRLHARVTASYRDGDSPLPLTCVADTRRVIGLDFAG